MVLILKNWFKKMVFFYYEKTDFYYEKNGFYSKKIGFYSEKIDFILNSGLMSKTGLFYFHHFF